MSEPKPVLIYDDHCGFCRIWIEYWQRLTGDRIEYAPSQEVGSRFPQIPETAFRQAVQLVRPDGSYSLAVLPGPGIICVVASPREDYAAADVMNKEWAEFLRQQAAHFSRDGSSDLSPVVAIALGFGQPGPLPINKYHALNRINPPEKAQSEVLDLPLRTAQTLAGTVLGPDGQPLGQGQTGAPR
jgi:hypothetical protein